MSSYSRKLKIKQLKIAELFSGIGAQNKALANLSSELHFNYKIELTCEWDMHAILAYNLIHGTSNSPNLELEDSELVTELLNFGVSWNGKEPLKLETLRRVNPIILRKVYESITTNNNCVNIKQMSYHNIPVDLDIMTYSFPCQDLSNMGHLHGYSDGIKKSKASRSGLLWEIDRVLKELKTNKGPLPKVLLMENVTSLLSKRHNGDFNKWIQSLKRLGYESKHWILKAKDFGIPQNRERLIMISIHKDFIREDIFNDIESRINERKKTLKKLELFLKTDYTQAKYQIEALESQPNDTKSREKIWNENPVILSHDNKIAELIPTITTKQDRHPNSGNIYFKAETGKADYRFLTPRECFTLMGFDENDYERLDNGNLKSFNGAKFLSKDVRYKLAGNSVVVPILEAVFFAIINEVFI